MKLHALLSFLTLSLAISACATDAPSSTLDSEGRLGDGDASDAPAIEARVLSELILANGNTVTFFHHPDGGVVVREQGDPRTNAIGNLPELAAASPFEIFRAIAPAGMATPDALVADQQVIVAERARTGEASSVPAGYRVDARFYDLPHQRAFNSCTDNADWQGSVGQSPIGSNCPAAGSFAYYQCLTDWSPPLLANCAGNNCTEYFLSGYRQSRSSVCARAGTGSIRFAMGIADHGDAFQTWFDHTLSTGAYYYYWYSHASQKKDFWRLIYRTGDKTANKSWWLKS